MSDAMRGKLCVITGATSGIGLEAAVRLGAQGARLLLVGRDPGRCEAALTRLRAEVPGIAATATCADLSRLGEARRLAGEIAGAEPRIDVLVNNAGALFATRQETDDGLERTFALNHMSYFLFTLGLLPSLTRAAPSRVVSTASGAHRRAELDFGDLQCRADYSGWRAYCRSKLANILFTGSLARRLENTGVVANCLHPGFVATRFGDNNGVFVRSAMLVAKRFAISPQRGADTIVHLAAAPEAAETSGGYFERCRPAAPSAAARDEAAQERLWDVSCRLAGLPSGPPLTLGAQASG